MSTTFISHRMFVAALNHENRTPEKTVERITAMTTDALTARSSNDLTIEQLAAFVARYWPEFPFVRGVDSAV